MSTGERGHLFGRSKGGATLSCEYRTDFVPTGPHSDGPMGVLITTNEGEGWRSATRDAAERFLGHRPRRISAVKRMGLDGVWKRECWFL